MRDLRPSCIAFSSGSREGTDQAAMSVAVDACGKASPGINSHRTTSYLLKPWRATKVIE